MNGMMAGLSRMGRNGRGLCAGHRVFLPAAQPQNLIPVIRKPSRSSVSESFRLAVHLTITPYSNRSASMGSRRAARRAGQKPKNTPMAAEISTLMTMTFGCTSTGHWARLPIR